MKSIWIIDEAKGFTKVNVPDSQEINISDISAEVRNIFNIDIPYQVFYHMGKRVSKLITEAVTESRPVGVVNISTEPHLLITFHINTLLLSLSACVAIENPSDKSLFDALLHLLENYNINELLKQEFQMRSEFFPNLTFITPLSTLPSPITIIIEPVQPLNLSLRIILASRENFLVSCSETMLGRELKFHIALINRLFPNEILIHCDNLTIDDELVVSSSVSTGSTVITSRQSLGGNCIAMPFTMLDSSIVVQRVNNAPDWRIVKKGLSWISMCCNPECAAFGNSIICNSGFGIYDLSRVYRDLVCPICGVTAAPPTTCGVLLARIKYYGVTIENIQFEGSCEHNDLNYHVFGESTEKKWKYLTITSREV